MRKRFRAFHYILFSGFYIRYNYFKYIRGIRYESASGQSAGRFHDIYTFEAKNGSDSLRYATQTLNPDYFLLNNRGLCEAYKTATGEFVMGIRTNSPDYLFYIFDGAIYFTGYHPGTTGKTFPMMDLPELMELAKSVLSSDTGIRNLTNTERAKFYID